ncbi:hypothetical protein Agub_g11363 [Astrephomene gubernaculifera]|uniref:SRR1-like domain-containing protein n=1 Tax=Astrephomene gubernaculifera TaxID=47775 RepID=A0AAD3DZ85_9CHLO|nr:hypothetical protein Agub_g11363 [Astrephomene gubernaculifera]
MCANSLLPPAAGKQTHILLRRPLNARNGLSQPRSSPEYGCWPQTKSLPRRARVLHHSQCETPLRSPQVSCRSHTTPEPAPHGRTPVVQANQTGGNANSFGNPFPLQGSFHNRVGSLNSASSTATHSDSSNSPPSISSPAHGGNYTLYGSRTTVGRQLLQLLLSTPPVAAGDADLRHDAAAVAAPEARGAAKAASAAASEAGLSEPSLDHVAALVRQVAQLMQAHSDMGALRTAMDTCAAQANAARSGSSGSGTASGRGGSGATGPPFRTGGGFFGGVTTATSRLAAGSIGSSHGSADAAGIGGNPLSTRSRGSSWFGGSCNPHGGSNQSSRIQQPISYAGTVPGAPEGPLPPQPAGNQALSTACAAAAAASSAPPAAVEAADVRQHGDAVREWDWRQVRRVVVAGLGSLAAYRTALRSGRQTERESSRAVARLYQLALSLVLGSPVVLTGLLGPEASSSIGGSSRRGPEDSSNAEAGVDNTATCTELRPLSHASSTALSSPMPTAVAAAAAADTPSGNKVHAATENSEAGGGLQGAESAAATSIPAVLYFDPEYLDWDLELIRHLRHQGCTATKDPPVEITALAAAAPPHALVAAEPTLFYAPCCPRELYDTIIRSNLATGTLHNVALIGNSLRAQSETALLLQALGGARSLGGGIGFGTGTGVGGGGLVGNGRSYRPTASSQEADLGEQEEEKGEAFLELVSSGRVAEVMLPDFAAHGVATCLHLFV